MPVPGKIELSLSDPGELRSLSEWLSWSPEVEVKRVPRPSGGSRTPGGAGPGEQGAFDVLSVVAGSSALVAAIKVLPEFLRAKRSALSVEMTVKGKRFTVTADNADDVLPIVERLLDD